MDSIPERIQRIKKEFKLSNVGLSKIAEISKQSVGSWINQGAAPASRPLLNLKNKLGINPNWVIYGIEPMLEPQAKEDLILKMMGSLDPAQQKIAIAFINGLIAANKNESNGGGSASH